MGLKNRDVISKILRPVGRHVSFKYPGQEGVMSGTLAARVVVRSGSSSPGVRYWNVVDRIDFPKESHREWMRVGYYRQVRDEIRWASQTTITEPLVRWRALLAEAARRQAWFRELLRQVLQDLRASGSSGGVPKPKSGWRSSDLLVGKRRGSRRAT